jgi:hypothetical protein
MPIIRGPDCSVLASALLESFISIDLILLATSFSHDATLLVDNDDGSDDDDGVRGLLSSNCCIEN